ncbi:MAG: hypothetical protein UY36_C0009G0002 [Parcubacteria group bacterium GW2011_GWA1_49_11]|uniref:Uncharacterized protein n=1 Tax=Candidatus Yanofskybacteria bacterium RIFCSPHIGHO2_01_FULL_48_25b TaxID=1802672 RepID=A0A1F8F4L3_9BACT|nr:MAG: hypothetical protein UY36_C0009G0002 [Parcubacteria group bacterium GW2011_GWA1_49_11]OGN07186.1 MAG: hypothetical protein A2669_00380 [Candidatus Yanofskybacteria bacterium RIFCSPHIGHO2_01_FULL_48_25b]
METVVKRPLDWLTELRSRKVSLIRLSPENPEVLAEVAAIIIEMGQFRLEHPQQAGIVMQWELELLDSFPGVEQPDDQN